MKLPKAIPMLAALVAFTASTSVSAYTWDSMAIGGGGFVSAVIPSKSEQGMVYARTDVGGAYRWDKTAARWRPLLDWVNESEIGYLGVESLAIDPKNAGHVVMLAGIGYFNDGKTAILRSTDYGNTFSVTDVSAQFKAHGNGMGRQNGEKLSFDPGSSNVLYVGTRANGLFKSTNYGYNWTRMAALDVTTTSNANGISFVLPDPASVSGGVAQRMLVGVSRFGSAGPNFYRTDNAGTSFTALGGGPASTLMPQRAVLDGAGNAYITYANGAGPHGNGDGGTEPMSNGQIWKYNLNNWTWTNVTPAGVTAAFGAVSVDSGNSQRLVASTINLYAQQGDSWGDRIYVSNNGGASWTDVIARGFAKDAAGVSWVAGKSIHWAGSIAFDPFDSKAVWVTSGNGIFKTSNIDLTPTTWRFDVKGLEETVPLSLVSVAGGPVVSAIGDYDGFRHSSSTAYGPIHTPNIGTTTGLAHAVANTGALVRVGTSMMYTWDGGNNWTQTNMNGIKGHVALSPNGGVLLHNPENSSTTYRSTNMGASWTTVSGLSGANLYPTADTVNSNKFYVYSSGQIMVSTNGGVSFANGGFTADGGSGLIRVAPGREGDVWVPLRSGGLSRSTNSGVSFSNIASVTACESIGFGKAEFTGGYPTVFIWGTVNGVRGMFRSTNTGASWVRVNDDAHEYGGPANGQFVVGDMNTFGVVYMSTAGRGIAVGKP